ncbi:ABC transporter substrate-binding protein [Nocardioides sp. BP30]|uniref:heme/hemin ABC transporter substrate-binding protein n=1 Tax=Nocardioides sp. BP30 TaxID=3036374 RepID=UPI00246912B7|nr:ABC transporter substrate-binding protein [Nocardioides sp. BP30]WGL51697.1 ABC transporter substrate-binding protein [Nocardioides sp. BP30]
MPAAHFSRPAIARAVIAVLLLLLAFTACGSVPPVGGHGEAAAGEGGRDAVTVPLSQVKPLADPKSYDGAVHAGLPDQAIDPIELSPVQDLPVTVTDAQGTRVTIEDTGRILALDIYGTLAQTVFDLGLGEDVVGRDVSTQFAEAARLPLVTGQGHELIAEKILALDPTVILTDTSLGPWNVILQMREAGIPVVVLPAKRSIASIGSLTERVAAALGVAAAGKRLAARTDAEVRATQASIAKVAPRTVQDKLRTIFLYVRGQSGIYYLFGDGSGAGSLIDAVGGYDVAHEIGWSGMKPVTDEAIISAQPELILMMTDGLASVGGVDGLLKRLPALAQTPAGRHHRVVDMTDSAILGYGPRTPQVLNSLAVAIYAPQPSGVTK